MRIYISGKITGIEDKAYQIFEDGEKEVKTIFSTMPVNFSKETLIIVNPMKLPHLHDKTWEAYMKEDLKELLSCDAIYMLKGWSESKGAAIEYDLANKLGLTVIHQ